MTYPKYAICNVAHPGSMESLEIMLGAVGIELLVPDTKLRHHLITHLGCDTVVDLFSIADAWGWPIKRYQPASIEDMYSTAGVIYVDVKAHRNGPKVWKRYPDLEKRTLWYFINGGKPADYTLQGKGDELNPPCPVLTPDLWYERYRDTCLVQTPVPRETLLKSYACWPPLANRSDYNAIIRADRDFTNSLCLVHNLSGWGYGDLIEPLRRDIGLRCFGGYGSPDGLVPHNQLYSTLSQALCMVHLKSVDAPGYSLYEALASGCPVVIPERFIHRCRAYDLLEPGGTCLTFDRYDEPEPIHVQESLDEIVDAVSRLRDPHTNWVIGEGGRNRIDKLMWSKDNPNDVGSLRAFMERHFS